MAEEVRAARAVHREEKSDDPGLRIEGGPPGVVTGPAARREDDPRADAHRVGLPAGRAFVRAVRRRVRVFLPPPRNERNVWRTKAPAPRQEEKAFPDPVRFQVMRSFHHVSPESVRDSIGLVQHGTASRRLQAQGGRANLIGSPFLRTFQIDDRPQSPVVKQAQVTGKAGGHGPDELFMPHPEFAQLPHRAKTVCGNERAGPPWLRQVRSCRSVPCLSLPAG